MTEANNETEARLYRRALACMQLIYPDLKVTGEHSEGTLLFHVEEADGTRLGVAFDASSTGGTNAELLKQLTEAAHRATIRRHGKFQPYVPGVDPKERWPAFQPVSTPPSDSRLVFIAWDSERGPGTGNTTVGKFENGQWFERSGFLVRPQPKYDGNGNKTQESYQIAHWRDLSAYEKATAG